MGTVVFGLIYARLFSVFDTASWWAGCSSVWSTEPSSA